MIRKTIMKTKQRVVQAVSWGRHSGKPGHEEGSWKGTERTHSVGGLREKEQESQRSAGDRMGPEFQLRCHPLRRKLLALCAQIWVICFHSGRNPTAHRMSAWPGQPHSRAPAARCQPQPADRGGSAFAKGVPGWLH